MASDTFRLLVITPLGIQVDAQVSEVEVPGADGEIGFLPGHIPYAGILDVGVLSYKEAAGEQKLVVKKGFCSFSDETLTVLADATRTAKATTEELAQRESLNAQLAATSDPDAWQTTRDTLKEIEASESL